MSEPGYPTTRCHAFRQPIAGPAETTSIFNNTAVPVGPFNATFVYLENKGGYTYPTDGVTFVLQNSTSGVTALGGSRERPRIHRHYA